MPEENKYFFWIPILILLILSFFIIKPYIVPLISAFILAYLTRPVYKYLVPKLGKTISGLLCVLIIIVIIILPLGTVIGGIISQAQNSINAVNANSIRSSLQNILSYPLIENLNLDISSLTQKSLQLLISLLRNSALALPSIILAVVISLFAMYYILTNWEFLAQRLKQYIPSKNKEKLIKEISQTTNALVYGTLLIGLIEFIVSAIGFFILGIKSYLLLAIIIFIFAFIPALGPTLVWLPVAIYYIFTGNWFIGIGVIILGLIISVGIDGLLKLKFLDKKTNINPLIMLIGILGGVPLFGIFGFIIGPLILVYTIEILEEALSR